MSQAMEGLVARLLHSGDETLDEAALLSRLFVDVLKTQYNVLSLKTYRIPLTLDDGSIPITPCLSHEAQLHEHDLPHVGGYVQHCETGRLMGLVYVPLMRRIIVEEESPDAEHEITEICTFLRLRFPEHDVRVARLRAYSAYVRARVVAEAHLPIIDVLTSDDYEPVQMHLSQLNGIAVLMEKESRVSSWGIRTAYAPLAAAVAFVLILLFPSKAAGVTEYEWLDWMRIVLLLLFGASFLYYGLKAVQLTKTATRLNKRIREYEFVLDWRARVQRRVTATGPAETSNESSVNGASAALAARLCEASDGCEVRCVQEAVRLRYQAAFVVLGKTVSSMDESLEALCELRLNAIMNQRDRTDARLSLLEKSGRTAREVTERARLLKARQVLEHKAGILRRTVGSPSTV
jgi:hypothetical protein